MLDSLLRPIGQYDNRGLPEAFQEKEIVELDHQAIRALIIGRSP